MGQGRNKGEIMEGRSDSNWEISGITYAGETMTSRHRPTTVDT